jgi:hypothetical protein
MARILESLSRVQLKLIMRYRTANPSPICFLQPTGGHSTCHCTASGAVSGLEQCCHLEGSHHFSFPPLSYIKLGLKQFKMSAFQTSKDHEIYHSSLGIGTLLWQRTMQQVINLSGAYCGAHLHLCLTLFVTTATKPSGLQSKRVSEEPKHGRSEPPTKQALPLSQLQIHMRLIRLERSV